LPVAVDAAGRGISVELRERPVAGAPVAETVRLYERSYALVIGIDRYRAWPRLSKAVADAGAVARALKTRGFEVTLLKNLKAEALETAFEDFFLEKGADPEARLFVWFAGHGHTERGQGYLVPADGPLPQSSAIEFRRKALSMRRFGEYVREAQAKHVLAVFDSCFAGTIFDSAREAPPPAVTRATTRSVRQFLTSGDAEQKVSDDGRFRRLFLDALAGERRADANGDGYLTGSELGLFLADRVSNYSRNAQTPRYGKLRDPDFDQGDFVFQVARAAPPASSRAGDPSLAVWQGIKDSKDAADYRVFLATYPDSPMAPLPATA
jgi:hypothetical protein